MSCADLPAAGTEAAFEQTGSMLPQDFGRMAGWRPDTAPVAAVG